ncbi:GTP cyclohydrolase 1 feedback regulatory protein [Passer domesticus]
MLVMLNNPASGECLVRLWGGSGNAPQGPPAWLLLHHLPVLTPCCYFLDLYLPAINFRFLRLPYPPSPCPSSPSSLPHCSSSPVLHLPVLHVLHLLSCSILSLLIISCPLSPSPSSPAPSSPILSPSPSSPVLCLPVHPLLLHPLPAPHLLSPPAPSPSSPSPPAHPVLGGQCRDPEGSIGAPRALRELSPRRPGAGPGAAPGRCPGSGGGSGGAEMPYLLISTQIRLEAGPTMVGDEHSDPHLMSILGATKRSTLGNNFCEYYVNDAPRLVLDKLESLGYRVVSMTGVGQTLVWCLHRE